MKQAKLLLRGLLAIVLTGIVSSFLYGVVLAIAAILRGEFDSLGSSFEFVATFGFLGSVIAIGFALIMAILIEIPKAVLIVRKKRAASLAMQIGVSAVSGAVLLVATAALVGLPMNDISINVFPTLGAGFVEGLCSAAIWWRLLIRPALASQ